ncbi:MAG: hypothetical protein K6F68_04865 [Clostridiales bacterium]|nr:hypothetical protein [Clostridiales bacterium]
MTKKILGLVLAAIMIMALVPMTVFAAEATYNAAGAFVIGGEYLIGQEYSGSVYLLNNTVKSTNYLGCTTASSYVAGTSVTADIDDNLVWIYEEGGYLKNKGNGNYLYHASGYNLYTHASNKSVWTYDNATHNLKVASDGRYLKRYSSYFNMETSAPNAIYIYAVSVPAVESHNLTVHYYINGTTTEILPAVDEEVDYGAFLTDYAASVVEYQGVKYYCLNADELPASMPDEDLDVVLYFDTYANMLGIEDEDAEATADASYPWTVVNGEWVSGNYHVASSVSSLTIVINNAPAGAVVTFDYYVESEYGTNYSTGEIYDGGKFYVNGEKKWQKHGANTTGYVTETVVLEAGTTTLKFEYVKDSSGDTGADCFKIKNFKIDRLVPPTFIQDQCKYRARVEGDEKTNVSFVFQVNFNASFFTVKDTEYGFTASEKRYEITGATVTVYDNGEERGTGTIRKIFSVNGAVSFEYRITVKNVPNDKVATMSAVSTLNYSYDGTDYEAVSETITVPED